MLHLLKLCVGCDSIRDLEDWIEENRAHHRRLGRPYEQTHTTRMVPKRMDAIIDGGSLYWVIKGQIACRQRLTAIRPFTDGDGIGRCRLVHRAGGGRRSSRGPAGRSRAGATSIRRTPRATSPARSGDLAAMPETLRRELVDLGLL